MADSCLTLRADRQAQHLHAVLRPLSWVRFGPSLEKYA